MGHFPPPRRRLCPPHLPPPRQKIVKISHFRQIFGFLLPQKNFWTFAPLQSHFAPSMPPPQISGAATGLFCSSQDPQFIYESVFKTRGSRNPVF